MDKVDGIILFLIGCAVGFFITLLLMAGFIEKNYMTNEYVAENYTLNAIVIDEGCASYNQTTGGFELKRLTP